MQLRIHQALNKWRKRNFNFGDADCCQFAGFIVQELTGKNYLATFAYQSEVEADEIIFGFGGLEHTVESVLGDSERSFNILGDGSPVLCNTPHGQLLGVKLGSVAIALGKKGFINLPQSMVKAGWNICKL